MIGVVIDTNVVESANLIDEGPSAAILDLAVNRFPSHVVYLFITLNK